MVNIEEVKEEVRKRIFTKSMEKKGFKEAEIKELILNDNFYQPNTVWFTKQQIIEQIPRLIKIFKDHPYLVRNSKQRGKNNE